MKRKIAIPFIIVFLLIAEQKSFHPHHPEIIYEISMNYSGTYYGDAIGAKFL